MTTTYKINQVDLTPTAKTTTLFGRFEVEVNPEWAESSYQPAYIVTGPRGASFSLYRNANNPHLLFAINNRSMNASNHSIAGCAWFIEDGAELKARR